jgi:hypothetical protein
MEIALFPSQFVCATYPLGQTNHSFYESSPCEIRTAIVKQPREQLLTPMVCKDISNAMNDNINNDSERAVSTKGLAASMVVFNLDNYDVLEQVFLTPSNKKCPMATLQSESPFRAPPLV